MKYTKEEFVRRARLKHGDKYDYEKTVYVDSKTKVKIICPIHGEFWQRGGDHLSGCGCPKCSLPKGEERIGRWLDENNIKYYREYKIPNVSLFCFKRSLRIDFYLPDQNVFIEYNGGQHYFPVEHFGGEGVFEQQQYRDDSVKTYCKQNGIKLIEISYKQYNNIEKILKRKIMDIKTKYK